jgi:putative ABC transport system substrate-binding protein
MIPRRKFLVAAGAAAFAAPLGSFAQQQRNVPRIGLLWIQAGSSSHFIDSLRQGLRAYGYVDEKNIRIDDRFLIARYEGLAAAAAGLVGEKVSVIVVYGSTAVLAAHKATSSIPIVMVSGGDPVKLGLIASLARPGGNITGLTQMSGDLSGKRLELLKEVMPSFRRFATLLFPGSEAEVVALRNFESAARALNLESRAVEIRTPGEIESAIAGTARTDAQAIAVVGSTLFHANRAQVVAAIAKVRKPAIYVNSDFVESGGLVSYGANISDNFRRAATFIDKILKGAKPGDLPVEQPTKIELAVNLRTARALGITVPQSILVRADKVIQ